MGNVNITIDMEKEFLKAQIKNNGMIGKMAFYTGYPEKEIIINSKDLFKAILKDVEELEEKKNENAMPIEAYEKRLNEANETISSLLKENKDCENIIDKLQQVIVAQSIQLLDVHTENKKMQEYTRKLVEDTKDPK